MVVGVYSYDAHKIGKWVAIDIDNHNDQGDPKANERYALHLHQVLTQMGFVCLLYESNGRGGFHLWVLFATPVLAEILHRFGVWLVRDYAKYGFSKEPEVFPKSTDKPWGNWLRMVGRHHTRDIWPRVWSGSEWVNGEAAVAHVLSLDGVDPALIPTEAAAYGVDVQTGGSEAKRTDRPTDIICAFEAFNSKATLEDTAAILERHGWTRGRTPRGDKALEMTRPGKKPGAGQGGNILVRDGVPVFFCFTDAAPPLKPMEAYTPAALVALLEHGGDFKASNTKLYEAGYGTRVKNTESAKESPRAAAKAAAGTPEEEVGELVVSSLAVVVPEPVHFLVPDYIPLGMLGMLAGEGGHGKSMTTLELAAALSVGRCAFGLSYPNPLKGKTLLISCEDDWGRTVVPRLAALGADRSKILRVEGVRMKKGGKVLDFHMCHFRELERMLTANPDIRLIVIDPAGAYIGRAGINENHDADLRAVLGPLSETANRTGATVLLIKHLNKSAGVSAVQRVGGSTGYVNAVRFAYMIAPDPDDNDKKLVCPIKANVLPSRTAGLAYRMESIPLEEASAILRRSWSDMKSEDVEELAKQLFRQKWEGSVTTDADAVAGRKQQKATKGDAQRCIDFIREFLGEYAHTDSELEEAVKQAGFSPTTLRNAKGQMRGVPKDDPTRLSSKPKGEGGPWWVWIGSQYERPADRPDPSNHTPTTAPLSSLSLVRETGKTERLERLERLKTESCAESNGCTDSHHKQSIQSISVSSLSGGYPHSANRKDCSPPGDGGVL
jgi:hypothetical protein